MVTLLLLTGLSLLFTGMGWWSWKKPRRRINPLVGYRTARSMKSQAAWDFAQVYSGRTMFYTGIAILALAGILLMVLRDAVDDDNAVITIALLIVPTVAASVLPLYLTERKLKQLFDKEGNPIK